MLCADSGNSDEMLSCTERLKALNLPLLIKKGDYLKIKGEMFFKLEDVSFKIQEIP